MKWREKKFEPFKDIHNLAFIRLGFKYDVKEVQYFNATLDLVYIIRKEQERISLFSFKYVTSSFLDIYTIDGDLLNRALL